MDRTEFLFGLACFIAMGLAVAFFWHHIPERCASGYTIGELVYNMSPALLLAPATIAVKGLLAPGGVDDDWISFCINLNESDARWRGMRSVYLYYKEWPMDAYGKYDRGDRR